MPVQVRSAASVQAILEATIQVLLKDGKPKLTTTRIAQRAGVSVGTLYQYFPNKRSLLQALLRQHLEYVALAMERACEAQHGASLAHMAEAIAFSFAQAKFRDIDASLALYAISDEVEGQPIAHAMRTRVTKAMAALLQTSSPFTITEPRIVAATLLSAMAGVSRTMLEEGGSRRTMARMQREMTLLARAYLQASATHPTGYTAQSLLAPTHIQYP